jgi:endoglucanase
MDSEHLWRSYSVSNRRLCTLLLSAVALFPLASRAQYAHTQGEQVIGRNGKPLLLRGTNLGNWMVPEGYMWQFGGHVQSAREIEALVAELIGPERSKTFWQQWRDNYVTQSDIHLIHQAGFNSIRVPMHYRFFQSDDAEGFRLLDRLVKWSRAEGIYLVLDMHAAPGGQTGTNIDDSDGYPWLFTDQSSQQQLLDTWHRIARHYRNEPVILGYDLLNEPIPTYPKLHGLNPLLEPLYKRTAAVIRKEDKHHILILGGAQWDNNFDVFGPPFDSNVIYEWHKYKVLVPDQSLVQRYVDFRTKNHVPIWLGESGENKDEWLATFRTVLEKNNIGWAFWPYKKLANTTAVETVTPPADWPSIVAYAKLPNGVGLTSERLKDRPEQEVIDRAFAQLIENIKLSHCTTNLGYVRALLPETTLTSAAN